MTRLTRENRTQTIENAVARLESEGWDIGKSYSGDILAIRSGYAIVFQTRGNVDFAYLCGAGRMVNYGQLSANSRNFKTVAGAIRACTHGG